MIKKNCIHICSNILISPFRNYEHFNFAESIVIQSISLSICPITFLKKIIKKKIIFSKYARAVKKKARTSSCCRTELSSGRGSPLEKRRIQSFTEMQSQIRVWIRRILTTLKY